MQVNNSQPSFGSTLLKLTPDTPVANKYLNKVRELFELKGFMGDSYVLKPQLAADQIDFSQAAVITKGSDMIIVGKNGGENGYDTVQRPPILGKVSGKQRIDRIINNGNTAIDRR